MSATAEKSYVEYIVFWGCFLLVLCDLPASPNAAFFDSDDSLSDVLLLVEEQPVYFNKALLTVSSPVFAGMLTRGCIENLRQMIPLPEEDFTEFVAFLKQLHPVHSWKPLLEGELEAVLKLADEYDVAHLKEKCTKFIRDKMEVKLNVDQLMLFLMLSDTYKLTGLLDELLILASDYPVNKLDSSPYFSRLEGPTQTQLFKKRCQLLEEKAESQQNFAFDF